MSFEICQWGSLACGWSCMSLSLRIFFSFSWSCWGSTPWLLLLDFFINLINQRVLLLFILLILDFIVNDLIETHDSIVLTNSHCMWTQNERIDLSCLSQVDLVNRLQGWNFGWIHFQEHLLCVLRVKLFNCREVIDVGCFERPPEDHSIFTCCEKAILSVCLAIFAVANGSVSSQNVWKLRNFAHLPCEPDLLSCTASFAFFLFTFADKQVFILNFLNFFIFLMKHLQLLSHMEVVKLNLTDEWSMFEATIERLESLKDAIDNEWVVLIANSHKVSVWLKIGRLLQWSICLRDINTNWVSSHTLDYFYHCKFHEWIHSQVTIVACRDDPMLLSLSIDSECHQVIDYLHVEPQNHERVYFVNIIFEVAYDVVKGPMREYLMLLHQTVFKLVKALIDNLHWILSIRNLHTLIVGFFIRIIVVEIKWLNTLLYILYDLLSRIVFEFYIRTVSCNAIILLTVFSSNFCFSCHRYLHYLGCCGVMHLAVLEEHVQCSIIKYYEEFVRVFTFFRGFEPFDHDYFSFLLDTVDVVKLVNIAFIEESRIITVDCSRFTAK